jgi:predicted anti-sigma-YlaC factor YlaD
MNAVRPSLVCQRIREQVSLQLDDELSQLEERMLAAHLLRCSDCRVFEQSVREFTEDLRAAPLESQRQPIAVRRRTRRVSLTAGQVSAAATLAVAVLGVLSQVGMPSAQRPAARSTTANLFKTSWQPERELAQIDTGLPRTNRPAPFSAV